MADVSYLDPEQFNSVNDKLDFKFILMRQIDMVRVKRSVEMMGGYWDRLPYGNTFIEKYIPDTRESYINAVKNLKSLLIPYWDEDFTSKIEKIIKDFKTKLETERKIAIKKIDDINKNSYQHEETEKSINNRFKEFRDALVVQEHDLIFEECLKLCVKAKLIGGNKLIEDEV